MTIQHREMKRLVELSSIFKTLPGAAAILQCSDGDWCCDGNRVAFNCCNVADTDFFSLPSPSPIAFISNVPSPTSAKTVHNSPASQTDGTFVSSDSAESSPTSKSSPSSSSTTQGPTTSSAVTHTSTTTGKDGSASTVTQVVTVAPAAAGGDSSDKSSNHDDDDDEDDDSSLGLIVGLAVGIPVVLALLGIALFFYVRRMRQSNKHHSLFLKEQTSPIAANYANISPGTHAPELDSFPVAPGRSKSGRRSELYGSGVPINSPNPSIRSNGSAPPQYSPGGRVEPAMSTIQEQPAELWGGYTPYTEERARKFGTGGVKMDP
ncbi:uncharacterized protein LTR77_007858 [Saxophila tyrrhenica]|uniref:Mid2 domain-containing protein n=1 Tax=Saxophila tyrrhenica TaxID=1690608 RepID=A0AAV9P793_9PEZI|nr:hypothetical protein LTR77_007858 [Saxophila tyrrhenica]